MKTTHDCVYGFATLDLRDIRMVKVTCVQPCHGHASLARSMERSVAPLPDNFHLKEPTSVAASMPRLRPLTRYRTRWPVPIPAPRRIVR